LRPSNKKASTVDLARCSVKYYVLSTYILTCTETAINFVINTENITNTRNIFYGTCKNVACVEVIVFLQ